VVLGAEAAGLQAGEPGAPRSPLYGPYFAWCVALRAPFGEILPTSAACRVLTAGLALLGVLYPPYLLALVALRRPTEEQYVALREALRAEPLDLSLLGPGLLAPDLQAVAPATLGAGGDA
jgi:hypothetical protein